MTKTAVLMVVLGGVSGCATLSGGGARASSQNAGETTLPFSEDVVIEDATDDSITVRLLRDHDVLFVGECARPSLLPAGRRCANNAIARGDIQATAFRQAQYETFADRSDLDGGAQAGFLHRLLGGKAQAARKTIQVVHQWRRSFPYAIEMAAQPTELTIREVDLGYTALLVLDVETTAASLEAGGKVSLGDVKAWLDQKKASVSLRCTSLAPKDLCIGISQGAIKTSEQLEKVELAFTQSTATFSGSLDGAAVEVSSLSIIGYRIEGPSSASSADASDTPQASGRDENP